MKLSREETLLAIIDVQEKIFATMHEQVETEKNILRLITGAKALDLPIVWTEQYPKGLGPTLKSIREAMADHEALEKIAFSCFGDRAIRETIESLEKNQVLVCGIEAHVCVYQTAADLMENGYNVHVVSDAVMSRKASNWQVALQRMRDLGANVTSVEMALFELQAVAKGESFKAIAEIIK
ncbi:MAG: hydrolase [Fidelibacterota bacterium]